MRGTKYLAVPTMPMVTRPARTPFRRAIVSSASLSEPSTRRACRSMYSPPVVSVIWRPPRSKSGNPTASSRSRTCIETAGGVRCNSSAARANERWRATIVNTRSWRIDTFNISNSLTQ